MSTIYEIDQQHMDYLLTNDAGIVTYQFKAGKYQTYGAARNAMRTLMDGIGYQSLTQIEKEIVGRWNLISDQEELDSLFKTEEQLAIIQLFNSHLNYISSSNLTITSYNSYYTVDQVNYNGANEIHQIKAISRCTNDSTTYGIRVYDINNRQVIAEKTNLTNTKIQINDLGTILYQPNIDTIVDIQIKVISGAGKIKYESCSICCVI